MILESGFYWVREKKFVGTFGGIRFFDFNEEAEWTIGEYGGIIIQEYSWRIIGAELWYTIEQLEIGERIER